MSEYTSNKEILSNLGWSIYGIVPTAAGATAFGAVTIGSMATLSGFIVVGGTVFSAAMLGVVIGMGINQLHDWSSKKFLRIDPNSNSRLKESVIYKVVKLGDGIFGLLALKDIRKDIKALAEFKMHYAANKIIIEATPMKLTKLLDAKKFKRLVKGFEHARHSQRVERLSQAYGMGTVRLNNKKVKELIGATFEAQWDVVGFANNVRGWADELGDTETYAKADSLHAGAKAWTKAMNKEILQWLSLQRGKPISHEEIERRWDRLH